MYAYREDINDSTFVRDLLNFIFPLQRNRARLSAENPSDLHNA